MNRRERRRQAKGRRNSGRPNPDAVPILDQAFAHQQAGNLEAAVQLYQHALAVSPGYGPALNNLGAALKDLGRLDEAAEKHRAAIKSNPKDGDAHYNLGLVAEAQGLKDDAEAHYRAALKLNADDAGALNNLGALMVADGRAADALDRLERAAQLQPDQAEILNTLACALIETGSPDRAARHLARAIEIKPGYDEAHQNLGAAMIGLGRTDEALKCFDAALAINPGHAGAQVNRGIALMAAGRADDAGPAFEAALRADPGNVVAAHMVAAMKGETTGAAPDAFVRTLFDLYARRFDEHLVNSLGYRVPEMMAAAVARVAKAPERFRRGLDLGCGTGLVGENFRQRIEHLEGVDLAPRMIEKAAEKGLYDALHVGELVQHLKARAGAALDLVLAADTFIYIGELRPVFEAVRDAVAPGAVFAFSLESTEAGDVELRQSGRYAHGRAYVEGLAGGNGFTVGSRESITVRTEFGQPIRGHLFVLTKD